MNPGLKTLVASFRDEVATVAQELSRRGWAEANAGNFSIRLNLGAGRASPNRPLARARPRLAGCRLLVKQAGRRMRDLAANPGPGLCLVRIGRQGLSFSVAPQGARPTSELETHLAVQDALARSRPEHTCVLHTHPTSLIALSLLLPQQRELVPLLCRLHSEGPVLLQGRLSVVPFLPPGSAELARATAAAARKSQLVVWPCHGVVATGPSLSRALDLVEVADKAASIALLLGERRMLAAGLTFAQELAVREAAGLD